MADDPATHWEQASKLMCFDVLVHCARDHARFLGYPDGRRRFEARLEGLPTAVRHRILLTLPLTGPMDVGLHAFFRSPAGDLAADVLTQMKGAGFDREARLMQHAIDAFGEPYPASYEDRSRHFSRGFHSVGQTEPDPPTQIDFTLRTLDESFGAETHYAEGLARLCEADGELRSWLSGQADVLSEQNRIALLIARAFSVEVDWESPEEADPAIAAWPDPFGQLFLLWTLQFEVQNGGVHQYFFNSHGVFAQQTRDALMSLGLHEAAGALNRALAMFGAVYPRDTERRRRGFFPKREWNEWDEALQGLSDEFDDAAITRAMIGLAKRHGVLPTLPPIQPGQTP